MHFASPNALTEVLRVLSRTCELRSLWVAIENVPNGTLLDGLRPVRAYPPVTDSSPRHSRLGPFRASKETAPRWKDCPYQKTRSIGLRARVNRHLAKKGRYLNITVIRTRFD